MTLNQAIEHCNDVADLCSDVQCKIDHLQLAAWLVDYKKILDKRNSRNLPHICCKTLLECEPELLEKITLCSAIYDNEYDEFMNDKELIDKFFAHKGSNSEVDAALDEIIPDMAEWLDKGTILDLVNDLSMCFYFEYDIQNKSHGKYSYFDDKNGTKEGETLLEVLWKGLCDILNDLGDQEFKEFNEFIQNKNRI